MTYPMPIKILGMGRYLPKRVVTNETVEQLAGMEPGAIDKTAAGVRERRWIEGEESNSFMGAEAAREALDDAGLTIDDVDLILNASGTQEMVIPDGSTLIQRQLGKGDSGLTSMSVHTTCLSFLAAFNIAANFLTTGQFQKILIVSSDVGSRNINPRQTESFTLFGDVAAAAVVARTPEGESSGLRNFVFRTYGEGAFYTMVNTGTAMPPHLPESTLDDKLFHMEGKRVFRMAHKYGATTLEELRPGLSKGLGDIRMVVPHQASGFALKALAFYGWPDEKVAVTVDRLGNCIAASLPATLYEVVRDGRIERGDEVLLIGTGAGLSIGGAIITY